jgi:vacuolar-type H+-ATPase subunit D/Vma8
VLEQKQQTLLREQQRLAVRLAGAAAEWERLGAEAAGWNERALAIAGARRLRLAALHRPGPAEVTVERRNTLGVVYPETAVVEPGKTPDFVSLGGGASVALAARAHAEALAAAAEYAAARAAHEAISAEVTATSRRRRAVERRWIPDHETALHRLELALDERELEDHVRVRWALHAQR